MTLATEDQSRTAAGAAAREFNPSQLRALDLSSHVAVTAAAGSGKTTVLVERFVRILESNGFHPERIVSITFTEEAAAQMQERIREAMDERLRARQLEAPGGPNLWRRAARLLSLAKITTIHGFCLSLLREYPLDAGLDPRFQVPAPAAQQLLLEESIGGSLEEFSRLSHPALAVLLDYINRAGLESMLRQMVQRRNHLGRLNPGDSPIEILTDAYRRETAALILRSREWVVLEETLQRIPARLLRDSSSCARRCQRQRSLFQQRSQLGQEAFLMEFDATFSICVSPSRSWKDSGFYEPIKGLWDSLKKEVRKRPLQLEAATPIEEAHFQRALNALGELYRQVIDNFQRRKRELGVVDFEDLLEYTSRLLRKGEVREAVRQRYRHFLVDEFQDTNHVQWAILEPLLGPESNLLAVGDAKQSIYRFRDADVSIFQKVQEWAKDRGRVVEMPENYRSRPALVEFFNQVFSGLFQGGLPYEAAHQAMTPCRFEGGRGLVETCFIPAGAEYSEPALVAAWALDLIDQGRPPGEIAVLLRARTRLKEYETALREAGVPFQTVGGVGFYERQEVLDLLNVLRFLADRADEVALAGVLRSPIFSFADEELFSLGQAPGGHLWEKLRNSNASGKAPSHWRFAQDNLETWIAEVPGEKIATALRRILRDSGYAAVLSESRDSRQSLGNVAKLMEAAREFEGGERRGLREFLRHVAALMGSEAAGPESVPAGPGDEHVRIYTIHGAKGLQFPVVVLPELGSPLSSAPVDQFLAETLRSRGDSHPFVGFKIRNPDDRYREMNHPVHRMLQKLDEYRQIAEEKRLLYVACTRAEERLVLIGRQGDSPSCLHWLVEAGAEAFQIDPTRRERLAGRCSAAAPSLDRDRITVRGLEEAPDQRVGLEVEPSSMIERPTWSKSVWTATEIASWSLCPRRFYLSAVEGIGEDHPLTPEPLGNPAALIGSAVHDILEKASGLTATSEVESRVSLWMERLKALFPDQEPASMRARLERHLDSVARSPLARQMGTARRVFHEKPFDIRFEDISITGVIDRLFEKSEGGWTVVDFKTNTTSLEDLDREVQDQAYDLQVQIYLWAVSRVLGTTDVEGVLFFTSQGLTRPVRYDADLPARTARMLRALPRSLPPARFHKTGRPTLCAGCAYLKAGACEGAAPTQRGFEALWTEAST